MKKFLLISNIFLFAISSLIVGSKENLDSKKENTNIPSVAAYQQEYTSEEISAPSTLPNPLPFYASIAEQITEADRDAIARLVFLEAGNQSFLGQKAVVEVIFNRVLSDEFPNTINEVIYQKNQFSPVKYISTATPSQVQYDAVDEVLSEIYPVLNSNVVFFSTKQYNDYLYERIGDHYFCYSTKSYELQKGDKK